MYLAVCQESAKDLLLAQYGLKLRKTCYQACYTRKESLRVEYRDIRPLNGADLNYVAERYQECRRELRTGRLC